jgi:tetratricopeptide (TPR) repeat protein
MSEDDDSGYFFFQSPWKNIFLWHFMEVDKEVFLITPTMDMDILRKIQSILIARSQKGLEMKMLLRFSEADFLTRGLNPEVLRILALLLEEPNSKIEIRFLPNLATTTIIMDRKKAILATGDLSSDQLLNDISFGELMIGRETVSDLLEDIEMIWSSAEKTSSKEIMEYMTRIKSRLELRSSQILRDEESDIDFPASEIISMGRTVEPLGKDRSEPHLDEFKKIIKELLIRARDAMDLEKIEAALFYLEEGLTLDPDNSDLLLEKGKILYEGQQYQKALACFDKVLDHNEDNRDAWSYQGMCHHELNDLDEALHAYDQATDIDPQHYPVWIKKGIILGKTKGREEDGLKCLEYALSQDPYNEEAWFNKAQLLEQRLGRMDEAVMSYRSLLRINPKHVVGSFRMGLLSYKKLEDIPKAKKYFNRVVEADPTHIHGWLFKSEIADNVDKDFDTAYDCLEKARVAKPDSLEVMKREIELLLRHKKKFKKAVELSQVLLDEQPKDHIALYVSGLGALKLDNDAEKALEFMNESIRANPREKRTIISKANILAEYLERSSDAVNLLRAAIKKNDKDPELWMELGMIYFDFLFDPSEAIECFNRVTELDKENSEGWYNKGMIFSRGFEKHQEGLKCLDQATRLKDDNYLAWHEKGRILYNFYDMMDDAMKCYQKALSIEPNDSEVLTSMAEVIKAKGDPKASIDYFNRAIEADPSNMNAHLHLAETQISLKDMAAGQSALTSALQIDPKNERIWMMKAEIFRSQGELVKAIECYKRVLRFNPDNQDALNRKTSVEAQLERNGQMN